MKKGKTSLAKSGVLDLLQSQRKNFYRGILKPRNLLFPRARFLYMLYEFLQMLRLNIEISNLGEMFSTPSVNLTSDCCRIRI